jgi:hypothetical protein
LPPLFNGVRVACVPPNNEDVVVELALPKGETVGLFDPNVVEVVEDVAPNTEGVELEVFAPPNKVEVTLLPLKGVDVGLVAFKVVEPVDLLNIEN